MTRIRPPDAWGGGGAQWRAAAVEGGRTRCWHARLVATLGTEEAVGNVLMGARVVSGRPGNGANDRDSPSGAATVTGTNAPVPAKFAHCLELCMSIALWDVRNIEEQGQGWFKTFSPARH